jgi:hypothetical protein
MPATQTAAATLETLTIDNCNTAATVICKAHPEWDTTRFNYDPSGRGHHSHGTGSNSACLFEGDFHFWAIVTYLPTAEETERRRIERETWLDANSPNWRNKIRGRK